MKLTDKIRDSNIIEEIVKYGDFYYFSKWSGGWEYALFPIKAVEFLESNGFELNHFSVEQMRETIESFYSEDIENNKNFIDWYMKTITDKINDGYKLIKLDETFDSYEDKICELTWEFCMPYGDSSACGYSNLEQN